MRQGKKFKPCGCTCEAEFETKVLSEVMVADWTHKSDGMDGTSELVVVANHIHSYDIVTKAGLEIQSTTKWKQNKPVQRLMFTSKWLYSFLHSHGMRRKRVMLANKVNCHNPIEVQQGMKKMQNIIEQHKISPKFTLSSYETGVFYRQGPKYQWVPHGATAGGIRATLDNADLKNRFTNCLTGNTEGYLLPAFKVIHCSVSKPDMSSVRVMKDLHNKDGFTAADGWTLHWWEQCLPIKAKKSSKNVQPMYNLTDFKQPYLLLKAAQLLPAKKRHGWTHLPSVCGSTWCSNCGLMAMNALCGERCLCGTIVVHTKPLLSLNSWQSTKSSQTAFLQT